MDWIRLCVIMGLMVLSVTHLADAGSGDDRPVWKDHPYLFVERSEVPAILKKAERHDWAKVVLDGIRKSADAWLERDLEFPPSTGRHSVTYICSACKEPLQTLSPTQHQCPKCEKVYSGLPYDARLYEGQHNSLARAASNLGLAALLFDNPDYARKALDILLGYAERYATYPLIDTQSGQRPSAARISDQTLNEAIWLIDMAWAYDLALGAGVGTEAERKKVEDGLLRASVETIKRHRAGKSNWQSWHNAGIIAVALCLKDEKLLDEVLHGDHGFFFQMENSIMPDGMWYEGSWSYHFYAVSALLRTAEAAYRSGINLYNAPQLKKALEVPLHVMMPNGCLPALNDGMEGMPPTWHYEIAAARYKDPLFEDVLSRSKRGGPESLILGMERPRKQRNILSSMVLDASGLAILRRGDQYLTLDFGPHGGGHGHLDKLALNFYTAGRVFAPDPGRGWPYNLPVHRDWYRLTLAHNTVVVDGLPQKECQGKLESYDFDGRYHTATAAADDCYEGVRMRRTVALGDTWLLDIFEVESNQEHTYDWVWHGRGEFATELPVMSADFKGSHASYNYLTNARRGDGSADWTASWTLPDGKIHALLKGSSGRQAFLCDAPDNPRTNTLHSVILRERAKESRFVALFSREPMDWDDLPEELAALVSGG